MISGWFRGLRKNKKGLPPKILVLVDLENITINLSLMPLGGAAPSDVIKNLLPELRKIGDIFYVFVFSPPHRIIGYESFFKKGLVFREGVSLIECPKDIKKIDGRQAEVDTVDEKIIEWCETIVPEIEGITHVCLCSGDADFLKALKGLKKRGLKIIIASGQEDSLARELIKLADVNPTTKKKMVFFLRPKN